MASEQITIEVTAPTTDEAAAICDFIASSMDKAGFEDITTTTVKGDMEISESIDAMRRLNPDLATYPVYISFIADDDGADAAAGDDASDEEEES